MTGWFRCSGQRRVLWAVVGSLALHAGLIGFVALREPDPPGVARGHALVATISAGRIAVDGDDSGFVPRVDAEVERTRNPEPVPVEPKHPEALAPSGAAAGGAPELRTHANNDAPGLAGGSGHGSAVRGTDGSRSVDGSIGIAPRVELPRPVEQIVPGYPRIAQRRGLEGVVVIQVTISVSGDPLGTEIVSPSDHRVLNDAAIAAVKAARFHPGFVDDRPSEMSLSIRIVFELS